MESPQTRAGRGRGENIFAENTLGECRINIWRIERRKRGTTGEKKNELEEQSPGKRVVLGSIPGWVAVVIFLLSSRPSLSPFYFQNIYSAFTQSVLSKKNKKIKIKKKIYIYKYVYI